MDLEKLKNLVTSSVKYKDQGHWLSQEEMKPEDHFGFLYFIYNKQEKKYYIGLKHYKKGGKKTRKQKLANGRVKRKTNTNYNTPSDWKEYMSSSPELKEKIKEEKKLFAFVCIKEYNTRAGLVYAEANLQHKLDVLVTTDKAGEKLFYNKAIAGIRFIPKEHYIL